MKKKIVVLLGLILCLSVTACAGGKSTSEDNKKSEVETESSKEIETEADTQQSEESEEVTEESEDEGNIPNIGESASLKDWEITVTDMKIVDTIAANYISFSPEEGNKYAQIFIDVTNNGKQADNFLPSYAFGDQVTAKILYGDGYEFSSTNLLGYTSEMHDSVINPLSSKSGEITFAIPDAVAEATEELILQLSAGNDKLKIKLR